MFGTTRSAFDDSYWLDPHWPYSLTSSRNFHQQNESDNPNHKFDKLPFYSPTNMNKTINQKEQAITEPRHESVNEAESTKQKSENDQDNAETNGSHLIVKWKEQKPSAVAIDLKETEIDDDCCGVETSEDIKEPNSPKRKNVIVVVPCCLICLLFPICIGIGFTVVFVTLNIPKPSTVSSTSITTTTTTTTTPCSISQYLDNNKCLDRNTEFVACSFDDMCLLPMTCDPVIGCTCSFGKFFDTANLTCKQKYTYNQGPCLSIYQCDETQNLTCNANNKLCECSSSIYTWSASQNACKLILNQGICTSDSECNLSEYLSCDISEICDCIRTDGYESYFDSTISKCVPVLTLGQRVCISDEMCSTLTQLTYCNTLTGKCECPRDGYLLPTGKCSLCKLEEYYFEDNCYLIVTDNKINGDDIGRKCKKKGSLPAVLDTMSKLDFFRNLTNPSERYWISGHYGKSVWNWGSTSGSLSVETSLCPLSNSNKFLNYENGCYNSDLERGKNSPFICQR